MTSSGSGSGSTDGVASGLGHVWLISSKVRCELCSQAASVYCAADEALLCWDCDARIHSANFLVARHSRSLICPCCGALLTGGPSRGFHVCQASAAWAAAAHHEELHCDEESKVETCSSGDDEEEQASSLVEGSMIRDLQEVRKRGPQENARWVEEGVGDSEDTSYSATFKYSVDQPSSYPLY